MADRMTVGGATVSWSRNFDPGTEAQPQTETPETEVDVAPEAAAPGSSTALHDLFKSLPSASPKPEAETSPQSHDWLRYVNLPTVKLETYNEDE